MDALKNTLYLIPVPIVDESIASIPAETIEILNSLQYFAVENLKTARRILRKMGFKSNFDTEVVFFELDKHKKSQDYSLVKSWMKENYAIGVMSEAGLPCIADPGNEIVAIAHQLDYKIKPLSGPSSIILALIASGFGGQNFAFTGYLPIEKNERIARIKHLEQKAKSEQQTQIFMETPYRNQYLFEDLINTLQPNTQLSIACNISAGDSYIKTKSIQQWKQLPVPNIHKKPTIFSISF